MKTGDYVDVHFETGCQIGKFISDEGETVTVELGTIFGKIIMSDIPKNIVTPF